MSEITGEKPETIRIEELDEQETTQKNNEETGIPKKVVDFSKVFSSAMAQVPSNIRKQPNKRKKREEILFEEEEDSSEEEFSEEDEDEEDSESEEEDLRWIGINKLLEAHLNITETILTMVKETKNS